MTNLLETAAATQLKTIALTSSSSSSSSSSESEDVSILECFFFLASGSLPSPSFMVPSSFLFSPSPILYLSSWALFLFRSDSVVSLKKKVGLGCLLDSREWFVRNFHVSYLNFQQLVKILTFLLGHGGYKGRHLALWIVYALTGHFLSLAAPAGVKVAFQFWASCLFSLDLLHLIRKQILLLTPDISTLSYIHRSRSMCNCVPSSISRANKK